MSEAEAKKPRLLVFVVAYYAERTLPRVLDRIPQAVFETYDCEVLVVDDGSEDRTFALGREYREAHPQMRVTVLRNEFNQGYGGNQKIGYAYAVAEGFDFVAMVHGDGQYAPEELPRLMEPLRQGEADAVFGSRMMTRLGALQGGMPFYKYVGNKVLTRAQNALLRTRLSEFHSGYRIYRVSTLRSIPFRLNANDFHFDTEIIIQLVNARARIVELPIPTYYGDTVSRVDGMKYAKEVMVAMLKNVAHRSGIFYQRKYDTGRGPPHPEELKLGYPSSHSLALEAVPAGAKVLQVGTRSDGISEELRQKGCVPLVVDAAQPLSPDWKVAEQEYVLLLDVVEKLADPEAFLDQLRAQFDHSRKVLVLTTPNVGFFVQRLMLLLGQFNYGKAGVLDQSHRRLFTFRSLSHLLKDAGFKVKLSRGIPAPFPKVFGDGLLGRAALGAHQLFIAASKTLFAYQIFIVAEGSPDVDFLLRDAKAQSAARAGRAGTDSSEPHPTAEPPPGPQRARPRSKSGRHGAVS